MVHNILRILMPNGEYMWWLEWLVLCTTYASCWVVKFVKFTNNLVKIHVVSDFILLQLTDGNLGVVDWTCLCWWLFKGAVSSVMSLQYQIFIVFIYIYIYISTVSVSLTHSGPRCVVDKACGLSANSLVRLLTALFDQNTLDDKNVYSSLFMSGRHIGSRGIAAP